MGMFDTYYAPCPCCGNINNEQSKSGPCILGDFNIDRATHDPEVALAFDGLEFYCDDCKIHYRTVNKAIPQIVTEIIEQED